MVHLIPLQNILRHIDNICLSIFLFNPICAPSDSSMSQFNEQLIDHDPNTGAQLQPVVFTSPCKYLMMACSTQLSFDQLFPNPCTGLADICARVGRFVLGWEDFCSDGKICARMGRFVLRWEDLCSDGKIFAGREDLCSDGKICAGMGRFLLGREDLWSDGKIWARMGRFVFGWKGRLCSQLCLQAP